MPDASFSQTVASNMRKKAMKHILTLAIATLSLTATQASAYELENVRAVLAKPDADGQCPAGSLASYVPLSQQGATGGMICAMDYNGPKICTGVKFMAVLANNQITPHGPRDLSCGVPVDGAWPWGRVMSTPNSNSYDWSHGDTYVVCCKQ
jgi:hypothetical protein